MRSYHRCRSGPSTNSVKAAAGSVARSIARLLSAAEPVPTIVIDDRVNPAFAQLAQDAGARGYVSKDFELPRLMAEVLDLVEASGT